MSSHNKRIIILIYTKDCSNTEGYKNQTNFAAQNMAASEVLSAHCMKILCLFSPWGLMFLVNYPRTRRLPRPWRVAIPGTMYASTNVRCTPHPCAVTRLFWLFTYPPIILQITGLLAVSHQFHNYLSRKRQGSKDRSVPIVLYKNGLYIFFFRGETIFLNSCVDDKEYIKLFMC